VNKNDLIASVADKTGLTKTDAGKAVDGVFKSISDFLKKKEEVRLVNFGTFYVAKRPATEGRNPRTGEKIKIPAKNQPKFRAGKGLTESLV
jgi:DNA-binding protein HU-beta